jgi:16S rRNA (uracil1498-N3)-methyltransferase
MNEAPLFFFSGLSVSSSAVVLDEDTRRHVVTVLRMQAGERILLTDGKGKSAMATIVLADKKKLVVNQEEPTAHPISLHKNILAVSLLKNAARFEWMLEKATEIGVAAIIPLLCERTERQHVKAERWSQVITSACLQSRQFHFPVLHPLQKFDALFDTALPATRLIAHCMPGQKQVLGPQQDAVLMIGPEGDFSARELSLAIENDCIPVSLGNTRLRTETAGIVGAVMMRNHFL